MIHGRIQRGGAGGPEPPEKNAKNIGSLCNSGPDPLKNNKATKQTFDDGPIKLYLDPLSPIN